MARTFLSPLSPVRKSYRSRLNRRQSPLRKRLLPAATVLFASSIPLIVPIFPATPLLPPLGLMMLTSWILIRPGIWPLWAGFLFGFADDTMSGQPLGTAALIWSLVILFLDLAERRIPWRDYLQDWLIASLVLIFGLGAGWAITGLLHPRPSFLILIPQMVVSIFTFPVIVRLTAALDRWRLAR